MALFLLLIGLAFNLFILIIVARSVHSKSARALLFVILGMTTWEIANYLADRTSELTLFWNRLSFIGPLIVLLASFYLVVSLRKMSYHGWIRVGLWAGTVGAAVLSLSSFVVTAVKTRTDSETVVGYDPVYGMAYTVFVAWIVILITVFLYVLFRNTKHESKQAKKQMTIIRWGMSIVVVLALVTNLILPNVLQTSSSSQLIPIMSLIYVGALTLAIVKHGLFDIKLAAVRSAAYILVIITLTVIYYVIAYLASLTFFKDVSTSALSLSPINFLIALALAFILQPIRRFFDRITNDVFYRDNYKTDEFFAELSQLLTSTTDLHGLLERASAHLATTFKAEQALFFVYYTKITEHHASAGTRGRAKLSLQEANTLREFIIRTNEKIFLTDLLDDQEVSLRRMLTSHKVALVMPLRHGESVVGYVMLGDHLSGSYSGRDLNVLLAISNELVIAIQNTLSLHEVKELNSTLQQRINVATKELRSSNAQLKHLDEVKDEFMSMASHQLRTPLTSVKGYISMVLEGDAGNVSLQQQKLLMEAFKSSERMVGLINDFLNVSRLQTGKFIIEKKLFDLGAVVEQEVSDLQLIARTHGIKLRLNATDHPLPLLADESKVRQVIMNYIDNAIYYSRANGTVVINLEKIGNTAALTVVDTGIGVPKEEQARLFNKFFRAKNARKARPDGTGVGLYLARRVIAAHGGSIIFSSYEGKGSTFGFRMPLSKESAHRIEDAQIPKEEPIQLSAAK